MLSPMFAVLFVQVIQFYGLSTCFTVQELLDTKTALMKSLGLKSLPRTAPRQNDLLLRRYSAPKFMMGLFKEVNSGLNHDYGIRVNASDGHYLAESKYLDETKVDTVISYFKYAHDKSWDNTHQDIKLKFKTNLNPQEDKVEGGELKIFKRLPRNRSMIHGNCTISVYLILPEGKSQQLLDTRDVHAWTSGWQIFNVTAALRLWAIFPLSNHGLKIVVHHAHGDLNGHSFGLVGTHGNSEKRPYLVGFVKTTRVLPTFTPALPTFMPEIPTSRERRATRNWRKQNKGAEIECKLNKLFVDFKEIGLHETIIAPSGYRMFFCQGPCTYPMDSSLEANNHAMLQSMLHLADPRLPGPCCVPSKLESMSVLFHDRGNIVLKQHTNMIAKSCKCT